MIQAIVDDKKYTLTKVDYQNVNGAESLYLEVYVEQLDHESIAIKSYNYGMNFTGGEIEYFMSTVQVMQEYVISKLVELGA